MHTVQPHIQNKRGKKTSQAPRHSTDPSHGRMQLCSACIKAGLNFHGRPAPQPCILRKLASGREPQVPHADRSGNSVQSHMQSKRGKKTSQAHRHSTDPTHCRMQLCSACINAGLNFNGGTKHTVPHPNPAFSGSLPQGGSPRFHTQATHPGTARTQPTVACSNAVPSSKQGSTFMDAPHTRPRTLQTTACQTIGAELSEEMSLLLWCQRTKLINCRDYLF
jgi:hypothetical protein